MPELKEVTEVTKRKLIQYSQDLFESMEPDPEYPFKDWQEQFAECRELYTTGGMSESFLNLQQRGRSE